jgi:hypothetical protein
MMNRFQTVLPISTCAATLWAGGDAAGAASGQVMYAPRPRVLAASPAAAAAPGGGGAAPVHILGSDMVPLPDGGGGWAASGGVSCVIGGRAAVGLHHPIQVTASPNKGHRTTK